MEIELAPVHDVDELDADERQRLHNALDGADEEERAGLGRSAADVLADLRRAWVRATELSSCRLLSSNFSGRQLGGASIARPRRRSWWALVVSIARYVDAIRENRV